MKKPAAYTVCEDQPKLDRWDVEIRTFPTLAKAEAFLARQYNAKERAGEDDMCQPRIRDDSETVDA
jgi:hypothetical protein